MALFSTINILCKCLLGNLAPIQSQERAIYWNRELVNEGGLFKTLPFFHVGIRIIFSYIFHKRLYIFAVALGRTHLPSITTALRDDPTPYR